MPEDPHLKKLELERELSTKANARAHSLATALSKESDRGCAIIGASFLEDQLEDLIRAICRSDEEAVDRLFEGYAPFATFSARIQAAFALRLISKELRNQLDLVRRIRNDFAHEQGPLSFNEGPCCDRLRALMESSKNHAQVVGMNPPNLDAMKPTTSGPYIFTTIVCDIWGQLEYSRLRVLAGLFP